MINIRNTIKRLIKTPINILVRLKVNKCGYRLESSTLRLYREDEGVINLGNNIFLSRKVEINSSGIFTIGNNSQIGRNSLFYCKDKIDIGSNCLISWNVTFMDNDSHPLDSSEIKHAPIIIEDNVWIGCNSIILKGVKIEKGSVVAAGSIVTKNVPEYCLVAGNPAKIIRQGVKWKK